MTEGIVLVMGAGAIGQYVGLRLAAGGTRVHLVGRAPLVEAVNAGTCRVTDIDGNEHAVPLANLSASDTLADAPAPALTLLTVKGGGTAAAAAELAQHLAEGAPVVSFQNGVDNVGRIREAAPSLEAIPGMVPYNVVLQAPGAARQTTDGQLATGRTAATTAWAPAFAAAGIPLVLHDDLINVQWGKLLVNLNNPINALSGKPLREQLLSAGYRRLVASLQDEALAAMRAAGIEPANATPLPSAAVPKLLRLPTFAFRLIASRMLRIDPLATSSMQEDRRAGRVTEVDDLCGAVVRLAQANGLAAPRNARIVEIVSNAPQGEYYEPTKLEKMLS